ncbi:MAG: crossover junction endodeoxyribonuclease RuvC [Candidatus Roseilinea sp.]|nr:MAG: crossover junction endodeoxyribonuclease RuvC [Candidatus Roseilinea sp.]
MITLGIDPGIATTGYGIVREEADGRLVALAHGAIETPKGEALPRRLQMLQRQLEALIAAWQPEEAAVEELFFATNAKTAMIVGQARGVVLLTLCNAQIEVHEYTPLQVKQAVSGYGQADKRQMKEMVRLLLGLPAIPQPDDAADALAIAVTHLQSRRWVKLNV